MEVVPSVFLPGVYYSLSVAAVVFILFIVIVTGIILICVGIARVYSNLVKQGVLPLRKCMDCFLLKAQLTT